MEFREYVTFDDVLIRPQYSDIESRTEISTSTTFCGMALTKPVISANMDYVTGPDMQIAMIKAGGLGILHRFMPWEKQLEAIDLVVEETGVIAFSVGTRDCTDSFNRVRYLDALYNVPHKIVCIDVAHGHSMKVERLVRKIKNSFADWKIIAGNVATAEGTIDLIKAGADAIKVGIGPGSVCTTRIVTGVGVPQLSAIIECANTARPFKVPVIADGGIRTAGDIVKALAAGATVVMVGNLLAGTTETPGEVLTTATGRKLKGYRGQSIFGTNDTLYTKEGVSGYVDEKGPVAEVLHQLMGGLRSGMSYVGARTLAELRDNTVFVRVSGHTVHENHPRVQEAI